jgi:CreA protein
MNLRFLTFTLLFIASSFAASAAPQDTIGSVDTAFKMFGPNHKIVVEVFDDPHVKGVACYVSKSKAGGVSGWIGTADEKNEASIACRQVGPISISEVVKTKATGMEVFNEGRSLIFKHMRVNRMYDPKRNVLVYIVYFDKLIDGSAKNSVTAVPVQPWRE